MKRLRLYHKSRYFSRRISRKTSKNIDLCDKTKVHHKEFPNVRKLVGLWAIDYLYKLVRNMIH